MPPPSGAQVPVEEGPDALPAVLRGLRAVAGPFGGEERVPGALVAVELVGLPRLAEQPVQLRDVLGRRVLVLGAEQPEQRAAQVGDPVVEGAHLQWEAVRWGADDERAVAVDGRVQVDRAGGEEGLPAAGAV